MGQGESTANPPLKRTASGNLFRSVSVDKLRELDEEYETRMQWKEKKRLKM